MHREHAILGCLLGTAVGDALGLRREGLSRRRAERLYGGAPLEVNLCCGRGMCSDDTEHTLMVARALVLSGGEPDQFARYLARDLKRWFLCVPAGIGLATLKSCLKLLIGLGPHRSGVFSAGNGPAMRAALLGVMATSDEHLHALVEASTRLTHTDPRAATGALLVAQAARLGVTGEMSPAEFLTRAAEQVPEEELRNCLRAACDALERNDTCQEFATSQGWSRGVSGYVNQTVPAALYCWARWPNDFRQCVESAVLLGGDSDSVAAIAGAISGANLGAEAIPSAWLNQLAEWPRTVTWMRQMATTLEDSLENTSPERSTPPSMHWLATVPRNLLFASVVVALGFRRLFPPY